MRLDRRGAGLGHLVMEQLETLAPAYDLLALSASDGRAAALRSAAAGRRWRRPHLGPRARTGVVPTPDDDGGVVRG